MPNRQPKPESTPASVPPGNKSEALARDRHASPDRQDRDSLSALSVPEWMHNSRHGNLRRDTK